MIIDQEEHFRFWEQANIRDIHAHILVKTTGIKAIIIITDITFLLVRDLIISFREVYQFPKL